MQRRVISLLLFLSFLQPAIAQGDIPPAKPVSPYEQIANELLAALPEQDPAAVHHANDEDLSEAQKQATVYQLFAQYGAALEQPTLVSTDNVRKDLEFFNQACLLNHVKRTVTVFGEAALARWLAQPVSDIKELKRRQANVQRLLDDPELFALFEQSLNEVKKIEPLLLSFFSEQHALRQQMINFLYFDKTLWAAFATDSWDKNEKMLLATEALHKALLIALLGTMQHMHRIEKGYDKFGPVAPVGWATMLWMWFSPKSFFRVLPAAVVVGITGLIARWYMRRGVSRVNINLGNLNTGIPVDINVGVNLPPQSATPPGAVPVVPRQGTVSTQGSGLPQRDATTPDAPAPAPGNDATQGFLGRMYSAAKRGFEWTEATEAAIFVPIAIYQEAKYLLSWATTLRALQKKFIRLAQAVDGLRDISDSLLAQQSVVKNMPELWPLFTVFQNPEYYSVDMRTLLASLKTKTFTGKPSFPPHIGRISAVNKLMDTTRYDWVCIFESIGYLDAYFSVAKLLKERAGQKNTYCFAQYIAADKPQLQLTDFWNPLLDPEKAVANSVELTPDHRNIILTGPNTGGKSTIAKGAMLSVILAQSLGIVPASACTLTPFAALNTQINITDKVSQGQSFFAAEVDRARQLLKTIESLSAQDFSLTIIDEIFKGTDREQEEELSHWFAEKIGKHHNSLCILATHCPRLIDLEEETKGVYQNYKVEIDKLADGTLKRNYKLQRGWTKQKVAVDILKEQGLMT